MFPFGGSVPFFSSLERNERFYRDPPRNSRISLKSRLTLINASVKNIVKLFARTNDRLVYNLGGILPSLCSLRRKIQNYLSSRQLTLVKLNK